MSGRWVMAAVLAVAGCASPQSDPAELVGTWVSDGYNPVGENVTLIFREDGTFYWGGRGFPGRYVADASTFALSYLDRSEFCPRGTDTWAYEVEGDTFTAHHTDRDCPEGRDWMFEDEGIVFIEDTPGAFDWHFERQAARPVKGVPKS